jgi:hypothetical protein
MRSERGEHRHRHVALVAAAPGAASVASAAPHLGAGAAEAGHPVGGRQAGWSLLRMSVPARLIMVAAAALLLWTAVVWAMS